MSGAKAVPETCDIAIVGGGTAGLSLATALKKLGVRDILVLEREPEAGGVPRHCGHYPFGLREYKRLMKGPDYARRNVEAAKAAGVRLFTGITVTALHPGGRLSLLGPAGKGTVQARRVVLCTGLRESSRAQRFIGGQRPLGVLSTGALQAMIYLQGLRPFRRPVILGSELVSFSAIMTCRHLGIKPVAMIEENERITVRQFMRPYPALKGVALVLGARDLRIMGERHVEAVRYIDSGGEPQEIVTDGVIVSGRFRPESALMRMGHLAVDQASGGPSVDQFGRCSDPAYFATGNLLRPVETSSWCWHEAAACAERVAQDLENNDLAEAPTVPLSAAHPAIKYVVPQRLAVSARQGGMDNMQLRLAEPVNGYLLATSGGKTLLKHRLRARPERRILAPLESLLSAGLSAPVSLTIEAG